LAVIEPQRDAPILGESDKKCHKEVLALPKGLIDSGEKPEQTAIREIREETGLTVQTDELLGVYDRVLRDEAQRTHYHYVLVDFLCRRVEGEARASGDADEVHWFTPSEAAKLPLAQDTAEVVRLAFEKARPKR